MLEPPLVRRPTKKHLELQSSKDNALKVVRANPGLGQGIAKAINKKLQDTLRFWKTLFFPEFN